MSINITFNEDLSHGISVQLSPLSEKEANTPKIAPALN